MADETKLVGQGAWNPIESGSMEELRDNNGFTHPNFHRRKSTATENRNISIGIYGLNSYRTTETVIHDEDSRDSEIP
ncbi:MAG: hypothetical protein NC227_10680 [Bacteroides sp.]|nr:hypothetical protein [Bacteroides sp.]